MLCFISNDKQTEPIPSPPQYLDSFSDGDAIHSVPAYLGINLCKILQILVLVTNHYKSNVMY